MGLLNRLKKKEKDTLKQDLTDLSRSEKPGMLFIIHLFMEEKCEMPPKDKKTIMKMC